MHRTIGRRRSLLWGTLLALLLSGLTNISQAQAPLNEPVYVPLNGTYIIQMKTQKPITKATAARDGIVEIRPVPGDPTRIRLVGLAPDTTKLEVTDGTVTEAYTVIVQRDIDNLRVQIRRAIPLGNISVTPMNEGTVLLTGTIARAADATVLDQVVKSLGFLPINKVDVGGVQQVQLDVVVALVSRSAIRSMAFDFLTNSKNFYFGSVGSGAVATPATAGTAGTISNAINGLTGGVGSPNGAPTNLLFGVLHGGWNFLGFLQALRDDNLLKLVAQPTLVTESGTPASFLSGGEQAIPVPAGLGQVGVQFEEFGTRLNFLPIVLGDNRIHLEVEPEISSLNAANGTTIQGTTVPGRDTERVHVTVQMEVGQTLVIGGLIQHQVIGSDTKVPIIGDLPFFGVFFSRKNYQETENEVLILVTPHLVEAVDCEHTPKILPGQETRSPDDFELFLECILEAPRGQRCVCPDHHYVPAYKNGPSASVYPCGEGCPGCFGSRCGNGHGGCDTGCANGGCANGSCANGSCGSASQPAPTMQVPVAPQAPVQPSTVLPPPPVIPTGTVGMTMSDTAAATAAPSDGSPKILHVEPLNPVPPPEPLPKTAPTPSVGLTPNGGQQP